MNRAFPHLERPGFGLSKFAVAGSAASGAAAAGGLTALFLAEQMDNDGTDNHRQHRGQDDGTCITRRACSSR